MKEGDARVKKEKKNENIAEDLCRCFREAEGDAAYMGAMMSRILFL